MEKWVEIRRRVLTGEISKRAACQEYGLQWRTLRRVLEHELPAGYQRKEPRQKPKLERFLPIIHEILNQDQKAPKKQRQAEVFVPLAHRPGEAQVDFGETQVKLCSQQVKVAMFVMTLPYSDAIFCQVFPKECTEAFQEGHKRAFEFFSGVPRRISYDNNRIAVAKITGGRGREVTRECGEGTAPHICLPKQGKPPGSFGPSGAFWIKSGDTYSRTFGTTIGSESLTTVFGMGTGVAFQISSPERSDRPNCEGTERYVVVVARKRHPNAST